MPQKACGPDDWNEWANGQCTSTKKSTKKQNKRKPWTDLYDWSWGQMEGLQGKNRIISTKALLLIAQRRENGTIVTHLIQTPKKITLVHFANAIKSWFDPTENGDQMIQEIVLVKDTPSLSIYWIYFDD
jgi:hypothetical protein